VLRWLPENVSTYGADIDWIFYWIYYVTSVSLVLVLATLAQRWRLDLVPGHPVEPHPVITLRLKHGLKMTLHERQPA